MFKKQDTAVLGDHKVSQKSDWPVQFQDGSVLPLKSELVAYLVKRNPKTGEKQAAAAPLTVAPPPKSLTVSVKGVSVPTPLETIMRNLEELNLLRLLREAENNQQ